MAWEGKRGRWDSGAAKRRKGGTQNVVFAHLGGGEPDGVEPPPAPGVGGLRDGDALTVRAHGGELRHDKALVPMVPGHHGVPVVAHAARVRRREAGEDGVGVLGGHDLLARVFVVDGDPGVDHHHNVVQADSMAGVRGRIAGGARGVGDAVDLVKVGKEQGGCV